MQRFIKDVVAILKYFHVNMPWKYLNAYLDTILQRRINVEIGFEAVELDGVAHSEFESIVALLKQAGCRISLHGPFWDLCPGSIDPLVRQISRLRLQQFFDLLDIFKPIQVVCHTGYDPRHHRSQRQFWLENSQQMWEPLVRQAESLKVPLLLENVWEQEPDFHRDLYDRIDSPYFGFCLDVGHQNSFSQTSLSVWLEVLGDVLQEVHLHDNDGTQDAHLPIGQGNIDFNFLFGYLQNNGKYPLFTLEPHRAKHLDESLRGLCELFSRAPLPVPPDECSKTPGAQPWPS